MKPVLTILLTVLLATMLSMSLLGGVGTALIGCEQSDPSAKQAEPDDEAKRASPTRYARSHAKRHGDRQARMVVFVAQEITQLDPRSDRSKRSREARELLDDIVPRETSQESP